MLIEASAHRTLLRSYMSSLDDELSIVDVERAAFWAIEGVCITIRSC